MAIPSTPTGFIVQQGNSQVWLTWDAMSGATSYQVSRSSDGSSYSVISSPSVPQYLDTSGTANTQYWYKVASTNSSGTSSYTNPQSIVPVASGKMTLGQVRLQAQQRADMVSSQFVGMAEWNVYIRQAAFELYDLLTSVFEDYYVTAPVSFTTDGSTQQYDLTTVAPNFYKLVGVDCSIGPNDNAKVTLKKFDFISRNQYVFPNITSTFLGVFNLRYRLVGSTLMFIPTPSGGQGITLWYIPRMTEPLKDTDVLDGVNGWEEYVIVRAAKYAMDKEESDSSKLDAELVFLKGRIEEMAANRDAGQPDTISDLRSWSGQWGTYGPPNGDGGYGGY
jgi:hypothetical protein